MSQLVLVFSTVVGFLGVRNIVNRILCVWAAKMSYGLEKWRMGSLPKLANPLHFLNHHEVSGCGTNFVSNTPQKNSILSFEFWVQGV